MEKTVMIVDDDDIYLEELGEVLASSGYKTVVVSDPLMAVETAYQSKPTVILLDLKMPAKNGFEIAYEMRYLSELTNVPIIAMSGYYNGGKNPLVELCGIKRCLKKPFNPLDVIWSIEETLKESLKEKV